MQVQERWPGLRQHPSKNSDRPEEALNQGTKETRWEPPQGWSHPRSNCGSRPGLQCGISNPRLSGSPSQSVEARTNDHFDCTVSSVDVQVPWANVRGPMFEIACLGQDTQSVFGLGRCSKKLSRTSCLYWRHEVQATILSAVSPRITQKVGDDKPGSHHTGSRLFRKARMTCFPCRLPDYAP
jgi:hypothetical protein